MTIEVEGNLRGANEEMTSNHRRFLMTACFVALVATSFAFIIRVMVMDAWQGEFGLSETQKGEIFGAGLWPFGVSIVLFSLVIDRIGYRRSMIFAFICHVASTILLFTANGYWGLYVGSVLNGLAAGTVEAVINPAIASVYTKSKTKMLTILHAGWPGGFVLGGVLLLILNGMGVGWQAKVVIILLPTILYGAMLLWAKFPVSERVAANVSYRGMLREAGAIGCLIVVYMICMEVNRVFHMGNILDTTFFDLPSLPLTIVLAAATVGYFIYTRSLGRPMYIFLLFVMILLAITELGTDTWIKELMEPAMERMGLNAGLVLVYTATIMTVLRFSIGPIEKRLTPLGVLFLSSLLAAVGLFFLSRAEGPMILVMATVYGAGQCFFWPVTLGFVAEQFPKGGALTLNAIAGVGMLGVGIVGAQLFGFWQDTHIDEKLAAREDKAFYASVMKEEAQESVFGSYKALDGDRVNEMTDLTALYERPAEVDETAAQDGLPAQLAMDVKFQILVRNAYNHLAVEEGQPRVDTYDEMLAALAEKGLIIGEARYEALKADKAIIDEVQASAKRRAMAMTAILPIIMALCYLGLMVYFRAKGGYKPVDITDPVDITH